MLLLKKNLNYYYIYITELEKMIKMRKLAKYNENDKVS